MDGFEFVVAIEAELKKRNIPKTKFYGDTGISSATFSQWRKRIYSPSSAAIKKVEDYLGITLTFGQKERPDLGEEIGPKKAELLEALSDMTDAEQALLLEHIQKIKSLRGVV